MEVEERAERAAAVDRISAAVRASARDGDKGALELEHALVFLDELDLRVLREIERELGNESSVITHPGIGRNSPGIAAFLGQRYAASIGKSQYSLTTPVTRIRADILDLLVFRDIERAHGGTMFTRVVQGVKKALDLPEHGSLAETGFGTYGASNIFLLLDVAASFATVQFERTSVVLTGVRGPEGMDLYADALDNCHFMTTSFARYLLKSQPGPGKLSTAGSRGRLERFGISPTKIDYERLLLELEKLRALLPELSSAYSYWGTESSGKVPLPPDEAGRDDEARMEFQVLRRTGVPRTAGEANEQRLVRRTWTFRLREKRATFAAACASVAMLGYWLFLQITAQDLSVRLLLLEAVLGALLAATVCSFLDARENGFFQTAAELNHYTVLQGRRDATFLAALQKVRPEVAGLKHAGLPRLFTVMAERDGVTFLGRGPRPKVVASFHWVHVAKLTAPRGAAGSPPRVAFVVRREGDEVELGFPLERAKVAWTQRNFLENKPMEAVLALLQGLRTNWTLPPFGDRRSSDEWDTSERFALLRSGVVGGTPYEREVLDWESRRKERVELSGGDVLRRTQMRLGAAIAALLFGIAVLVPFFSALQ